MLFVAWVFFCSRAVGSQKSKRELTSPFLLDSKQDLCVCVLQTSELLLRWKMRNSSHFLRWVLDLVGTSQVLGNCLTSKQAKKKRRMLKEHEHQTEDR